MSRAHAPAFAALAEQRQDSIRLSRDMKGISSTDLAMLALSLAPRRSIEPDRVNGRPIPPVMGGPR